MDVFNILLTFQATLQATGTWFLDYLVAALDPGYISGPYFAAFFIENYLFL